MRCAVCCAVCAVYCILYTVYCILYTVYYVLNDDLHTLIQVKVKRKLIEFAHDEHARPDATIESMQKLKSLFKKDGTVTAANASGISDGAGALILHLHTPIIHVYTPLIHHIYTSKHL